MSPKGLSLTQSKIVTCVFIRKYEKYKPQIMVIFYVENCCTMIKPEHADKIKNKLRKKFGIVKDAYSNLFCGILLYDGKI